jgi:glycosyltransferase involved in cell wall biosynthesis
MNCLQVSKFYHPHVGGIERVVKTIGEGIATDENTVRVLASVPRGLGRSEEIGGVEVTRVTTIGTAMSVPLSPSLPLHLRAASRDADLVHYHLPNPMAVTAHLLSGGSRARTVATYHNDIARQSTALRFYRPVLNRFLSDMDEIIVTSPRLAAQSATLSHVRDKCTVVPLSIDLDEYGTYTGSGFDLPTRPDRPLLLFVGRLIYYKGLKYMVDAMSSVDADLLIIGTGELREELERRAEANGVEDKISFLGYVSNDKLHYCYDQADVFVFPSIASSEGFGLVQLEAMAYRTPVVNTDLPTGVPWVSRHGETGLTVPPKDADALAKAVNELLADPEVRSEYGRNARERVAAKFSGDRLVRGTRRVYEQLLDQ